MKISLINNHFSDKNAIIGPKMIINRNYCCNFVSEKYKL